MLTGNVMVAGASGLIGSACMRQLSSFEDVRIFAPTRYELNLTDRQVLSEYIKDNKVETLIFAAGRVGGIAENLKKPADLLDENAILSLNGMWAASVSGVKRMIVFGSSCMYPLNGTQPMKEEDLLTGKMELTSIAYASAKILTIQGGLAYNRQYPRGTLFIPVIPNNVYGPHDNFDKLSSHVIAALISKMHHAVVMNETNVVLWGSGTPKREFVYSDDVATACLHLLKMPLESVDMPFNVTSGEEIQIIDLAKKIASIVGFKGNIVLDQTAPDGASRKALCGKRMTDQGWVSQTSLDTGISKTYEWFRGNYTAN